MKKNIGKDSFSVGQKIKAKIYNYDDNNEKRVYSKEIKGKVYQITDNFVVIDNGKYKECFKYEEFNKADAVLPKDSYNGYEKYSQDLIQECIEDVKAGIEGHVFNISQLNEVISKIKDYKCEIRLEDKIYHIKKLDIE